MRKFMILFGRNKKPLFVGGTVDGPIFFTKEEAEERLNNSGFPDQMEILEVTTKTVTIVTNKKSIV